MKEKICLNHVLGLCKNCKADEFNRHCPNYRETTIITFEVKEVLNEVSQTEPMEKVA